ncbi:VapE domain-containing protein [Larkinella humicola]|nr:VapE domain-containing protein [Larkinella humicola]
MNDKKTKPLVLEALISQYESQYFPTKGRPMPDITVEDFLWHISRDTFKKQTEFVQQGKTKEERKKLKNNGPNKIGLYGVTVSGTFAQKTNDGLKAPSGLIGIDLDDLNDELEDVRRQMIIDPYTFAVFKSISGTGLCVLVKIDPARFADAFLALENYYLEKYGRKIDAACKNISRLRYGSHDPGVFCFRDTDEERTPIPYNPKALLWKSYLSKAEQKRSTIGSFIHTKDDLDFVVKQVIDERVDITPDYHQRLRVCFALISELGESARAIFHEICKNQIASPYDFEKVDKMFTYALGYGSREIKIATFYYLAKEAGLQIMTPKTKEIVSVASMYKKQHGTVEGAVDHLKKLEIPEEESRDIVKQVFATREEIKSDETLYDQLELFLRSNHPMRFNEITRYYEDEQGIVQDQRRLNKIFVAANKLLPKVTYPMFDILIKSDFTPSYNPLRNFFRDNEDRKPTGIIAALAATIETDTGFGPGQFFPDYKEFFIRKWLIGVISSVYDQPCPIVLVLTGAANTGKTSWFRRLFPEELRPYFAESKWIDNRDNEMAMCSNLISFNDEFGKNGLRDHEHFKSLASKDFFTLREPYGRGLIKLRRLAVMCGTSNPREVIPDPHNNRRVIPINVISIDFRGYNAINKTDLLLEAYHLFKAGERHDLTQNDVQRLQEVTGGYYDVPTERDLIEKYFTIPKLADKKNAMLWSQGEILEYLTGVTTIKNLKGKIISQEMKAMGFPYSDKEYYAPEGKGKRGFYLYLRSVGPKPNSALSF